ncbi:MAG: hypothetical protein KJ888_20580 [Gammaproteobacteria bacterium]|nr:hypothetical protein [Gammaproteobacteria bacterium]
MSIELTDTKRYELEKENVINVILAANRIGQELTEEALALVLNIDMATVSRLITALRNESIIK